MFSLAGTVPAYLAGIAAATLVYALLRILKSNKHGSLPPGPKRLPVIGNLLDIPRSKEWLTYHSWAMQYGSMVYIEVLGNKLLVLEGEETIRDLVEKRVNWQHRPQSIMLNELMGFNCLLSNIPYGEQWRRGRKFLHAHLHAGAAPTYQPVQLSSARRLVKDLLHAKHSKDVLPRMVRANFGATIVKMTYGLDVENSEDDCIIIPEKVLDAMAEASAPGRFFVDAIPILKHIPAWFPGAEFQQFAAATRKVYGKMRNGPFERTKARIIAGTAPVSIIQQMLEDVDEHDIKTQETIKDHASLLYLAGADTTVAAVVSFFLAMIIYPEVQHRAQAELDSVVGRDRLPEFSDLQRLPYIKAVMSECLRWLPVLPIGIPHATAEDDTYRGFFIPKGTIVFPSQWSLLHDPVTYPNPARFSPERYLTRSSQALVTDEWNPRKDVRDPRDFAFGFGRRICAGIHVAEQSLFATVATVLHTLSIERARDEKGQEIIPHVDVSGGVLSHPKPFDYSIAMREDAIDLVHMCETL